MRTPIYEQMKQAKRAGKYPPDRICFLGTETAADSDKATFKAYQCGQIGLQTACKRIADANYLHEVTAEQFLNECRLLGYQRKG